MLAARPRGVVRRIPLLLVPPLAWLVCSAPPVAAQPYGPPLQVELSVVAGQPQAALSFGAADDVTYLASSLGLLDDQRSMLDGALAPDPGDAATLVGSAEFADYLTRHLRLSQAGAPCTGTVVPPSRTDVTLVSDPVVVAFRCPDRAPEVVADIDLLVDLHPAYRSQVRGPGGQLHLFAAEASRHAFDLPGMGTSGQVEPAGRSHRSVLVTAATAVAVLAGLALAGLVGAGLVRKRASLRCRS